MMNSSKSRVYSCCVCRKNSRDHNNLNLSFFRFPKDENQFAEWKKMVQCEKLAMYSAQYCYDHFRLCSLHFEEPVFAGMLKSRLKKNAKTCIHLVRLNIPVQGTLVEKLQTFASIPESLTYRIEGMHIFLKLING
ncbi:unnamed protein product [Diabrotica balteata]|uniref:THAP-type domain-containing protein n=1 Tax=Diabrotica balteata TaxID=107213 RepID=A0A9N9SX15_DIABA|nr:unnamed protein product [Diabrotica balteata]